MRIVATADPVGSCKETPLAVGLASALVKWIAVKYPAIAVLTTAIVGSCWGAISAPTRVMIGIAVAILVFGVRHKIRIAPTLKRVPLVNAPPLRATTLKKVQHAVRREQFNWQAVSRQTLLQSRLSLLQWPPRTR